MTTLALFDQQSLARQVDRVLATIPPDKSRALVATATVDGVVEFRFAERIGQDWSLGVIVRRERDGKFEGGVQIIGTW